MVFVFVDDEVKQNKNKTSNEVVLWKPHISLIWLRFSTDYTQTYTHTHNNLSIDSNFQLNFLNHWNRSHHVCFFALFLCLFGGLFFFSCFSLFYVQFSSPPSNKKKKKTKITVSIWCLMNASNSLDIWSIQGFYNIVI